MKAVEFAVESVGDAQIADLNSLDESWWVVAPVGIALAAAALITRNYLGELAGGFVGTTATLVCQDVITKGQVRRATRIRARLPSSFRVDGNGITETSATKSSFTPWRDVRRVRLMSESIVVAVRSKDPYVWPIDRVPGYTDEVVAAMRAKS